VMGMAHPEQNSGLHSSARINHTHLTYFYFSKA
jgi:hypothetical protein